MKIFKISKKSCAIGLCLAVCLGGGCSPNQADRTAFEDQTLVIEDAFKAQRSGLWVSSSGTVEKILPDDLQGSRHQRFIVRLRNGQTLLMSHNIDIAPRINNLKLNTEVKFYGEYEYNSHGGVIHWTHHDPSLKKRGGWIEYNGQVLR